MPRRRKTAQIAVVAIGGFQDLDNCEDVIASGRADLIAMARSFICDPEYGRKVLLQILKNNRMN